MSRMSVNAFSRIRKKELNPDSFELIKSFITHIPFTIEKQVLACYIDFGTYS